MTASAAEAVTPEKQLFTITKIPYYPGTWTNDGWDLANGNYPTDPTTIDLADAVEFDDTDYMFVTWNGLENHSELNVPIFTFAETTTVTEIVMCAIRAEHWHHPSIEVYAWDEENSAWDNVPLASDDLDRSPEYKPETTWMSVGSYRLIFEKPVAAKIFMIYFRTPQNLLGTGDGDTFWANEYTYAMGAVGDIPADAFATEAPATTETPATEVPATTVGATEAPATTEGVTDAVTTAPATSPAGNNGGIDTWVWIVIGIAVVAVAVAIVTVKKKK
jgi:hypothetical protein